MYDRFAILKQVSWTNAASLISIVFQLLSYYLIANKIPADDFGYFALAFSLIMIGYGIITLSFPTNLIYIDNKNEDINSVFTLNVFLSIPIGLIILVASILIFLVYENHTLCWLIVCMSPVIFFSCFISTYLGFLQSVKKFKQLAVIEAVSHFVFFIFVFTLLSFTTSVFIIALSVIIKHLIQWILLRYLSRKKATFWGWNNSNKNLSKHYHYGKNIVGEKVLSLGISSLDNIIVYVFIGAEKLGIYEMSKKIILRPVILLYDGFEKVVFSHLSSNEKDEKSYKNVTQSLFDINKYLFFNLLFIIYLFKDVLLNLLPQSYALTDIELTGFLLFACIIVLINPLDILSYSQSKTKLFFKWIQMYCIPLTITLCFSSQFGLATMLISASAFYCILYIIGYFFLKLKSITFRGYISPLIYLVVMAAILFAISERGNTYFAKMFITILIMSLSIFHLFLKNRKAL